MSNSNNDLSNCRKLLALLDSSFKGAMFEGVKVDDLSHSLRQVIELATPPAVPVQEPVAIPREWRKVLSRLAFMARTSGGTAGHDGGLSAACDEAEALLSKPNNTPPAAPMQDEFPLRGILSSELKCWHRLTEDEQINLLAFVKNTRPAAPTVQETKKSIVEALEAVAAYFYDGPVRNTSVVAACEKALNDIAGKEIYESWTPKDQAKLEDIEQYRMQMAGISTAAIGYWKEGDSIHPDYDTTALRDVAKLYARYAALYTTPHAAQRQCNWPTCQSEEYQQLLAEQIKQELVTGAAQPAVPDAIGPNEDELPAYAAGWNDCRQAMLEMMK